MSSEKVSVIIPIFNPGTNLETCLRSVRGQSFSDWECILVDDGSTDGSAEICDRFSEEDSRFIVIHQSNCGVSSARNKGLNVAKGEFISFIDSDDYISSCYLESLYNSIVASSSDLSVCGLFEERSGIILSESVPASTSTFTLDKSGLELFAELEKRHLLFGPVVKLYKHSLIEDLKLRFDESLDYGEDLMFNLVYLASAATISMVPEALYFYRRRSGTLSTRLRPGFFDLNYRQWKALSSFHEAKGLLGKSTCDYIYRRLWGMIYDGLFSCSDSERLSLGYIRGILSTPEIIDLKSFEEIFDCSKWIKRWILGRRTLLFYLYFKLTRKR